MLVASHRHTRADLERWAELEGADKVHAASAAFQRREDDALEEVARFLREGPAYCSCSWGKDSVVVAHLSWRIAPHTPVVWVRVEPIRQPDCLDVMDAWRKRFGGDVRDVDVWCSYDADGWHATGTLERGFRSAVQALRTDRRVTGIRAAESGQRELSARVHGTSTPRVCRPILRWSGADVFAYLYRHRLPVHPAYAMLGGGRWERERLRVSSLSGRRGDGVGRAEWEREYYGDVLARIQTKSAPE